MNIDWQLVLLCVFLACFLGFFIGVLLFVNKYDKMLRKNYPNTLNQVGYDL